MTATAYLRQGSRNDVTRRVAGALRPGYGITALHVGMTREQVRNSFGDPDQVRSFQDGTFFQYLEEGFDVDFGLGSKAERLFFYRTGIQKHGRQCAVTHKGIGFGSLVKEVERALGEPAQSGFVGKKQWLLFDNGIQFDLDARRRVEIIIVFRT